MLLSIWFERARPGTHKRNTRVREVGGQTESTGCEEGLEGAAMSARLWLGGTVTGESIIASFRTELVMPVGQ